MKRTIKFVLISLIFNLVYSTYHIILGITMHSWWFLTIGVYYAILSVARFAVIKSKGKGNIAIRFTGIILILLSVPLAGTVILAFAKDRGIIFNMIVMLAIATYAFTKITIATVNWIKARKSTSTKLITLRNISFADAFVSIFSLQRSMLVSFEGMSETEIRIMNVATGSAVCIIVFLLGLNLLLTSGIVKFNKESKKNSIKLQS